MNIYASKVELENGVASIDGYKLSDIMGEILTEHSAEDVLALMPYDRIHDYVVEVENDNKHEQ